MIENKLNQLLNEITQLNQDSWFESGQFSLPSLDENYFIIHTYDTSVYLDETYWGENPVFFTNISITKMITNNLQHKNYMNTIYSLNLHCEQFTYNDSYYEEENKGNIIIKKMYDTIDTKFTAGFQQKHQKKSRRLKKIFPI